MKISGRSEHGHSNGRRFGLPVPEILIACGWAKAQSVQKPFFAQEFPHPTESLIETPERVPMESRPVLGNSTPHATQLATVITSG